MSDIDGHSPEAGDVAGPSAGSPSEFLKNIVGKKVKVRIGSGIDYHGESTSLLVTSYWGMISSASEWPFVWGNFPPRDPTRTGD
jgi:hypothetical protein